jgi:hypothetical protein
MMINRKSTQSREERYSDNPSATFELKRRIKSGASNFFWIAGISVAYTVFYFFGSRFSIVIGLGITQFIDIVALDFAHLFPNSDLLIRIGGLALNILITGIFVVFGYFAVKGNRWAFITGMVLYGLDTILMLLEQDFIGLVFHLFFLWYLYTGLHSLNTLTKITPKMTSSSIP